MTGGKKSNFVILLFKQYWRLFRTQKWPKIWQNSQNWPKISFLCTWPSKKVAWFHKSILPLKFWKSKQKCKHRFWILKWNINNSEKLKNFWLLKIELKNWRIEQEILENKVKIMLLRLFQRIPRILSLDSNQLTRIQPFHLSVTNRDLNEFCEDPKNLNEKSIRVGRQWLTDELMSVR